MATDAMLSDEEYARQLQRAEFDSLVPTFNFGIPSRTNNTANNATSNPSQDISAPLLNDSANNENANPLLNNNLGANDNNNIGDNNNNNNNNNAVGNNNNNNNNAAQRARRNVIGHVRDADTDSPRILLLRITIALLETIATSTVLAIGWNEGGFSSCNYLKWWVLIYTARHFITIPLRIHIYRTNRTGNQPQQNNDNNDDNDDNNNANNNANNNNNNANNNNANNNNNNNNVSAEKSIQILRWLSIMTFLLFLLGQTFLFTEKTCQDSAPTVWYYCLVIIILVYVSLALPFLIVLAICICLPCVLIIFRFFAEPEGADDRIIKDLPTRKITAADLNNASNTNINTNTSTGDEEKKEKEKDKATTDNNNNNNEEEDDDDEGPSCAICMQDYKIDDVLRILPCKHEFHTECVDKWLPMKKICPLCRHDITKPAPGNNNEQPPSYQSVAVANDQQNSINNASANGNANGNANDENV